MTEYLDRYPTMHEYAEGKRINPKLTDLISRADAICEVLVNDGIDNIVDRINALPSADAVKRVDCSNFLLWLLEEIMDEDNWEFNAVADGEIIARKLKKLGLLEVKDGYYHRIFDENVWVVRCKDCEYADFNNPYPVCNFLEMNICENGYCSWARMKGGAE